MKTRFGLIRHAITEWNLKKQIQGQKDIALAPEGELQAKEWVEQLNAFSWDRIIVSDLSRALQTARIINATFNIPLIQDPRLREQDWGEWVGKTVKQIRKTDPGILLAQEKAGWGFCPPGGEVRSCVRDRCMAVLHDAAEKYSGDTILVVSHEGVIKSLIYGLAGRRFIPSEPSLLKKRCLHWLKHDRKNIVLEKINAVPLTSIEQI